MRFLPERVGAGGDICVILEHKGEQLQWNVAAYHNFKPEPEIILDINQFWSRLPAESLDGIWACYKQIHEVLLETNNFRMLDDELRGLVKQLFDYMPWEKAIYYMRRHSKMAFPENINQELIEGYSAKLTYFREDYEELGTLSMLLKAAAPIITQYVYAIKNYVDAERRPYNAMKLIKDSNLMDSPPVLRLSEYCEHFWIGKQKEMAGSALLAGLSSVEVPIWLVAITLYQKLVNAKLMQRGSEPKDQVVAVFHSVKQLCDDLGSYFKDRVSDKIPPKKFGNDEDKTSVAENVKVKSDVNSGDLVSHEFQSHQGFLVGSQVDETLPEALYQECLANIKGVNMDVNVFQRSVCQWVLYPTVSAKAMFYIDYHGMTNYLATAQALLIHWGFPTVALLMSSNIIESESRIFATNRTRMSQEQIEELDKYYPHMIPQTRIKHNTAIRNNSAAYDINKLTMDFSHTHWALTIPTTLAEQTGYDDGVMIGFPSDMEYELARLVIRLNEHWRRVDKQ